MNTMVEAEPSSAGKVDRSGPAPGRVLISYRGVSKAFGKQTIYRDLHLDVYAGETLCVIGPSGVGKSVMLKMLIGLLRADAGEIWVEGENVAQFSGDAAFLPIRKRIAMVFQGAALFDSMTVYDNIAYPLREQFEAMPESEIADRVAEKLAWVGLPGIEQKRPAELSGGMKKRVGLARSIATDPEVILYDEPTTGLDPVNTRRIGDLILSLRDRLQCTSIVVTHDMTTVEQVADRVAFVYDAAVAAVGTLDELKHGAQPVVRGFIVGDPTPFGD